MRVLTRHDPHPEVFAAYVDVLCKLGNPLVADQTDSLESVLRLFEKRVLGAIGYGLVFFDDEGETIDFIPDSQYVYVREVGPRALSGLGSDRASSDYPGDGVKVSGLTLSALRDDRPLAGATLNEAKMLMRFLLEPVLGERPLETRQLFSPPSA